MNWFCTGSNGLAYCDRFSATSTVVACCESFSVASNGQVYSKCAVQRTFYVLAFCDFIK